MYYCVSGFPFVGPVGVTTASPDSSCLRRRNRAAASRILLNSMQNACTSIYNSCGRKILSLSDNIYVVARAL